MKQLYTLIPDFVKKFWYSLNKEKIQSFIIFLLFIMFPLAYFESFRWPFPGPKATHGILKGLFFVLSAILILFRKKLGNQKNRTQNLLMLLFVFSYIISAFFSEAKEASLLHLWYPLISFSILLAFSKINFKRRHIIIFISLSALLIFITFVFSFFSIMFRYSVDNIYYFLFQEQRANHLLQEIRKTGKYVCLGPYIMLTPLCFVFFIQKNGRILRKVFSYFILLVSILTAVISNNRIDVLIMAIQLIVLLIMIPKKYFFPILAAVFLIANFGLLTSERYFGFNLEERILRPSKERDLETIEMRYGYWQTALYNFRTHPLFGTGPNTYNDLSDLPLRRYWDAGIKQYTVRQDIGIGIHNVFIERLADTGLFGFFSFILLLFYFVKKDTLEFLKRKKEDLFQYGLFSLASWTWILYSLTDNGYGVQGYVTFFFLRGVINHL